MSATGRNAAAAAVALFIAGACSGADSGGPNLPAARVDYVDGAVEPVLVRGALVAIEGYGFGDSAGAGGVTFVRAGGGTTAAPLAASTAWTDRHVRVLVPDDAVSGALTLTSAAGQRLTAAVHVLPRVPFDPASLAWQARAAFPQAPVGVALAAAELPTSGGLTVTLVAAGGAEPLGGDSVFAPDSGVYFAKALPGGDITPWARQHDAAASSQSRVLTAPRAFAAAAIATRHNSRFPVANRGVLYVVGGIDAAGRAQASVLAADVTPDSVVGRFVPLEPLPMPIAGAIAVVRRGRLYVIGGADSLGRPLSTVFVARVSPTGQIDGWYSQPGIPGPRAYGGGVVRDTRALAFGGLMDSVPPGGGLDATPIRLASADTASVSLLSGFFTSVWGPAGTPLPEPRSQFATLDVGNAVLVVGGMYATAGANGAETLAAAAASDSLGPFAGPVGTNSIAALNGGTLVGPAGITWRDASGAWHGLVLGGMDLQTRLRRTGTWGF